MMHDVAQRPPADPEAQAVPTAGHPLAHSATPASRWRPRSSVLRVRSVLYLIALDCVAIAGSSAVVAVVRRGPLFHDGLLTIAIALLPIYVFIALNVHAYAPAVLQNRFAAVRRGVKSIVVTLCVFLILVFYLKSGTRLSRIDFAVMSSTAVLLLAIGRYLFVRHLPSIVGGNPFSSILILDGEVPRPSGNFSVVIASGSYFDPDVQDPVMYDRLAKSLETADRVVVACPPARRSAWAGALRGANIQGEIVVPELASLRPLGLGPDSDVPSMIVAAGPLDLTDRGLKRVFDLLIALTTMVFVGPLLLVVAICIKLDSRGPVLFKQTRIGRGNRLFTLYKFRSMRVERNDGKADKLTTRDDDRVTRVGWFIRKTSIDELPQLIHVITGHMSIVGPRPHALGAKAASKLYWEVDQRYWDRHAAKPGLTGLAQVRGFRGNTFEEVDLQNRLHADLEYLENWSIWTDIRIILMTVRVLVHRNAF